MADQRFLEKQRGKSYFTGEFETECTWECSRMVQGMEIWGLIQKELITEHLFVP